MKAGYVALMVILMTILFITGCTEPQLPQAPNVTVNSLMVYKVDKPVIDHAYIRHLTDQFGFKGTISPMTGPEGETIINDGDKELEIFSDGGFFYHSSNAFSSAELINLPSKDKAIELAENYVKNNNLFFVDTRSVIVNPNTKGLYYPQNGTTITQNQSWAVGFGTVINGYNVVGPGAGIGVHVGDNGEITSVYLSYKNITPYKEMSLKSYDQAYSDFRNGSYISAYVAKGIKDKAITDVAFGYYMDLGLVNQTYVQPVYRFEGNDFTAYVSALKNESELR